MGEKTMKWWMVDVLVLIALFCVWVIIMLWSGMSLPVFLDVIIIVLLAMLLGLLAGLWLGARQKVMNLAKEVNNG